MLGFPQATEVSRRLPKEAFYRHLSLTKALKEQFVIGIERIVVENSLTKRSLNLGEDSQTKEILLLSLVLKQRGIEGKIAEAIAKQNPHKLLFLFLHGGEAALALYQGKLYRTDWQEDSNLSVTLRGLSLDELWENLVRQIALRSDVARQATQLPLAGQLKLQERIEKLEAQIKKAEAAAWKESQPKKKFALHAQAQAARKELEAIKSTILQE